MVVSKNGYILMKEYYRKQQQVKDVKCKSYGLNTGKHKAKINKRMWIHASCLTANNSTESIARDVTDKHRTT